MKELWLRLLVLVVVTQVTIELIVSGVAMLF